MRHDQTGIGLRDGIRELVREDSLNASEIARLHRLAAGAPSNPSRRRLLGAAAGIGVAAMGGYWGSTLMGQSNNPKQLAEEIAYNHLRIAPLDVVSGNLERLRDAFASLGFNLLDAAAVEDVPGILVGGRFCSVASVPAAMLRYRTDTGVTTVYQANHHPRRHYGVADMDRGEPGVIRYARGVEVCLCRSQGVLLAVATGGEIHLA